MGEMNRLLQRAKEKGCDSALVLLGCADCVTRNRCGGEAVQRNVRGEEVDS